MASVLGVDVGGTRIKAVRFSLSGDVLARSDVATPAGPAIAETVASIAAGLRDGDTVAVGIVLPGIVDRASGVVRWSANLGWRDVPLRDQLAVELGLPVVIEHDVTAAAIAEYDVTGSDLLFVSLGTGIGAAYIVDDTVRPGASGLAGELGHVLVRSDGEPCACGQFGCLEAYSSAAAVARRYIALGGPAQSSAADVVAARDADPLAASVWSDAVDALGTGLATATLLLDPARIVLGGGLTAAGADLLGPVTQALAARLRWRPAPPLSITTLGLDAGVRGAALLAREGLPSTGAAATAVPS
jgi:glucokinase